MGNSKSPLMRRSRWRRSSSKVSGEDILALQDLDPALNSKMHLVNDVGSSGRGCRKDADQVGRLSMILVGHHTIRSCFSSTGLGTSSFALAEESWAECS